MFDVFVKVAQFVFLFLIIPQIIALLYMGVKVLFMSKSDYIRTQEENNLRGIFE